MFYRCESCGGNVVYDPIKKKMVCESCGNEETQQVIEQKELHVCNNCGGNLEVKEHTLAFQCPYCQTYIILEDHMQDVYKPDLILPFSVDKHKASELMQENFRGKLFLPKNFCSTSSLESMKGIYVPFWMYDVHSHIQFEGEGEKIRTWREGDYECTETKVYRVEREFEVDYNKIPVDASVGMQDDLMDLIEPYEYGEMGAFDAEFLSGFQADTYEEDSEQLKPRAAKKVNAFSQKYLDDQTTGYVSVRSISNQKKNKTKAAFYAFLPIWRYVYRFDGVEKEFFVNGQTGKVIGAAPISKKRAVGLSALTFASVFFFLDMLFRFLGVL